MDVKDYFLIIGPLVGVVIGGLITSVAKWIEIRHQQKIELNNRLLTKLEEIHAMLADFLNSTRNFSGSVMAICSSHIEDKERRLAVPGILSDFGRPMTIISSKILIYAPDLEQKVTETTALMTRVSLSGFDFIDLHIDQLVMPEVRDQKFQILKRDILKLAEFVVSLQLDITHEIQKLLKP